MKLKGAKMVQILRFAKKNASISAYSTAAYAAPGESRRIGLALLKKTLTENGAIVPDESLFAAAVLPSGE